MPVGTFPDHAEVSPAKGIHTPIRGYTADVVSFTAGLVSLTVGGGTRTVDSSDIDCLFKRVSDGTRWWLTNSSPITWLPADSAASTAYIPYLESFIGGQNMCRIMPGNTTTLQTFGTALTTVGTLSHPTIATTSRKTSSRRWVNTSAGTAGALCENRVTQPGVWRGNAAGLGGFIYVARFSLETLVAGMRFFAGLDSVATATNVDPTTSTAGDRIGVCTNSNTGNLSFVYNTAAAAPTVVALGASFPVDTTSLYTVIIHCEANASSILYKVINETTGAIATATITSNLPTSTSFLYSKVWATNNATASAVAYSCELIHQASPH